MGRLCSLPLMKIMVISFKRSHACTAVLSAPDPATGHCQPTPLPETPDTHGHIWVSLLWSHCSFLLSPSAHNVLFVPSKCLFLGQVTVLPEIGHDGGVWPLRKLGPGWEQWCWNTECCIYLSLILGKEDIPHCLGSSAFLNHGPWNFESDRPKFRR